MASGYILLNCNISFKQASTKPFIADMSLCSVLRILSKGITFTVQFHKILRKGYWGIDYWSWQNTHSFIHAFKDQTALGGLVVECSPGLQGFIGSIPSWVKDCKNGTSSFLDKGIWPVSPLLTVKSDRMGCHIIVPVMWHSSVATQYLLQVGTITIWLKHCWKWC